MRLPDKSSRADREKQVSIGLILNTSKFNAPGSRQFHNFQHFFKFANVLPVDHKIKRQPDWELVVTLQNRQFL